MDNYILQESEMRGIPTKVKDVGKTGKVMFEAILQTASELNRNRRLYQKETLQEGINKIMPRVRTRDFLSELDHPTELNNPIRQITCLFSECSHLITDLGWDGNKLIGVVETLDTPKGRILSALIRDRIPVGFSMRGTGSLSESRDAYGPIYKVESPLNIIAYDSVSVPSHSTAKIIKITESVNNQILESINVDHIISESAGVICTEDEHGRQICYLPNTFDNLVEQRKRMLLNKFK